jgi:hypothetical protein
VEEAEYPERPRAAVEVNWSLGVCFASFFVHKIALQILCTQIGQYWRNNYWWH